jgi:aminopeptidase-like protein
VRTRSDDQGKAMMALIQELFPICRSITGHGLRQTLAILQRHIPLGVKEVPSGTAVLDWTVPREWNTRSAYIACPDGSRIADFVTNNLDVVQLPVPPKRCDFDQETGSDLAKSGSIAL